MEDNVTRTAQPTPLVWELNVAKLTWPMQVASGVVINEAPRTLTVLVEDAAVRPVIQELRAKEVLARTDPTVAVQMPAVATSL